MLGILEFKLVLCGDSPPKGLGGNRHPLGGGGGWTGGGISAQTHILLERATPFYWFIGKAGGPSMASTHIRSLVSMCLPLFWVHPFVGIYGCYLRSL